MPEFPLFGTAISAGFPSPADDYVERNLDLNEHLIHNQQATFFLRVAGDSMSGAGIYNGDLVIVDRSLPVRHRSIVAAVLDGEIVIKRLLQLDRRIFLAAENPNFEPIEVKTESGFLVWGVVTYAIHQL